MGLPALIRAGEGAVQVAKTTSWVQKATKVAEIAQSAEKIRKWKTAGKWFWRAVDVASIAAVFVDFSGGGSETALGNERAREFIFEAILNDTVKLALNASVNDTDAVCFAFAIKGTNLISSEPDMKSLTGLAFMTLANYLEDFPTGQRYSPEVVKDKMKDAMLSFLSVSGQIDEKMADDMRDALDDVDWNDIPNASHRQLDFIVYFFEMFDELAEYLGMTPDSNNSPERGPKGLSSGGGQPQEFTPRAGGERVSVNSPG